jgi:hypothetical protein
MQIAQASMVAGSSSTSSTVFIFLSVTAEPAAGALDVTTRNKIWLHQYRAKTLRLLKSS